jgi:hypothetical protein
VYNRPPPRSVRPTPPPLPPARRTNHLPWWLKPVGVVFLAVASIVLGAVGLPALRRPAAKPHDTPVEVPKPVQWGPVVAPTPQPDPPAVSPRLPSADGPYALSAVIDREIDRALRDARLPASPASGDGEFFRRVHLDLIGRVPSLEATRAFLADADPMKRSKVVDELLASPEHGQYLARLWADLLVKRDPDNARNIKTGPFIDWLAGRFNAGAKWDAIVTEMVCAEGDEARSPETFFIATNQDNKQPSPAKLTGAVGNLFLGVQIQCAECHRHPYHEKWTQDDFWGIAAFFGQTKFDRGGPLAKAKKAGPVAVREVEAPARPLAKAAAKAKAAPAAPTGLRINVPDPNDPRKVVKVATGRFLESAEPVPKGKAPYRPALARWLTDRKNPYFARAAVNRYWAHFFARGLLDPIEEMQSTDKATHPALLDALAEAFRDSGHDLKFLFRAILNSNAYQRTSRPTAGNEEDETHYARMPVKVMNAWQLVDSLGTVSGDRVRGSVTGPARGFDAAGKSATGTGGDVVVRALDAREVDDAATDFSYGIPQILRLMNTPLTASSAALGAKIAKEHGKDHAAGLEECFLITLTRKPRPEEVQRLSSYVAAKGPEKGYAGVLWALLNSAEFLSNH